MMSLPVSTWCAHFENQVAPAHSCIVMQSCVMAMHGECACIYIRPERVNQHGRNLRVRARIARQTSTEY